MRDRDYGSGGYGQEGYNPTTNTDYGREGYGGYEDEGWDRDDGDRSAGYRSRRAGSQDWGRDRGYGQGYQGQAYQPQGYQGYGGNQGYGGYRGQTDQGQGYGRAGYGGTAYYDVYAVWWTPGRHTGAGPKGYQRSDDRIREDVSERLQQSGQIDAHEVEVDVSQGTVTLKGTVPDRRMKRMAEDAVDSCPGVKDVHNELRVEDHRHDGDGQSTGRPSGTNH